MHEQTEEKPIRLIVLDDHGLFRVSLARLLASQRGLEVAGECGTSAEALEILSGTSVDIVLLDFDVGAECASEFISSARKSGYRCRFLIVAGTTDAEPSAMALKIGASGIFLKSEAPERLVEAIRLIASGAVWVDEKIIQILADECLNHSGRTDQRSGNSLETREQRTLQGILGGLSNRDIAEEMGISESSVKNILQGLFTRTGVRKRSQLVRLALEGSLGSGYQLAQKEKKTNPAQSDDTISTAPKQSVG